MVGLGRLVVLVLLGAGSAWLLSVGFWDDIKQGLLVALSVVAGAVMVRLARGLPFTNADQFEVTEIRDLTSAMRRIMRALKFLIGIAFASMVALVLAKPVLAYVQQVASPHFTGIFGRVESGLLGLLISYVFARILDVIHGDHDLMEQQATFVTRAVERRHAARFEAERQSSEKNRPFRNPEGYGKRLQ